MNSFKYGRNRVIITATQRIPNSNDVIRGLPSRDLNILVIGGAASGKSRVTYLLRRFLEEQNFNVTQELNPEYINQQHYIESMENNFDIAIEHIKERGTIKIGERQRNFNLINHE